MLFLGGVHVEDGSRWLADIEYAIVSACGSSDKAANPLNGAGSTFAYPLTLKWADAFGKGDPDVQIDYQPLGSSAGVNLITSGPMTLAELMAR